MSAAFFPEPKPSRPIWLVTLADLALLLIGFFVLLQANQHLDKRALARGLREGFGAQAPVAAPMPKAPPMPVAVAAVGGFGRRSSALAAVPDTVVAWARDALRDPRVRLRISGAVDGSADDVEPETGSGAVLAVDRARVVAAALARAGAVPPGRMDIVTSDFAGNRTVTLTLGFAGEGAPQPAGERP